jgi:hypothetical protein
MASPATHPSTGCRAIPGPSCIARSNDSDALQCQSRRWVGALLDKLKKRRSGHNQPDPLLLPETEENVDALLEAVRALLAEEDSRDQSFNTRGVGLAGFVGIVVSLSSTLGREALSATWGAPWKGIAVVLFGGVLLFLIASAIAVVRGVLQPREASSLSMSDVEKFALPEFVFRPKVVNQGFIMRGLIEALAIERGRAGRKASGLRWGYRFLLAGLASISILGFLLGLHDAKLIGAPHRRHKHQPGSTCVAAGCPGRKSHAADEHAFAVPRTFAGYRTQRIRLGGK